MSDLSFTVGGSGSRKPIIPSGSGITRIPPGQSLARVIAKEFGRGVAQTALNAMKNSGGGKTPKSGGPSKGKGNSSRGGNPNANNKRNNNITPIAPARGQIEVTRENVTWSSGVTSGLVFNPQQNTGDYFSPIFISCGEIFPNLARNKPNAYLDELINNYIYQFYLDKVLNYNFRLSPSFTLTDFRNYLKTVVEALQYYYLVDSILVYCSNINNQNVGMRHLRNKLSPSVVSYHAELGERLVNFPIPEPLLLYIRYMYQNFSFGTTSNCPIIRLSMNNAIFEVDKSKIGQLDDITYSTLFLSLNNIAPIKSILTVALKGQNNFFRTSLPGSTDVIFFDDQFCTFWHNSNIAYVRGKEIDYSVQVDSKEKNLYYGSFAQDPDGIIYASSSITQVIKDANNDVERNGVSQTLTPITEEIVNKSYIQHNGLWSPYDDLLENDTNGQSSLLCYVDGQVKSVQKESLRVSTHLHSAPYFQNPGWINKKYGYAGCQVSQVHSILNLQQAVSQTAKALLSI